MTHSSAGHRVEPGPSAALFVHPKLGSGDLLAQMWRGKFWMTLAGLPLLLAGLFWAASLPPDPVERGAFGLRTPAGAMAPEAELERLAADIADPATAELIGLGDGVSLRARTLPRAGQVVLGLQGSDGTGTAAPRLSDIMISYQALHAAQASEGASQANEGAPSPLAVATAERDTIDAERRAFLATNGLTDFETERARQQSVLTSIDAVLVETDAKVASLTGQVAALGRRLADMPESLPGIGRAPSNEAARLAGLRAQRDDLLTRYTPDSIPVRAIDRQIAALEAGGTGSTTAPGSTTTPPKAPALRPGSASPNPAFQAVDDRRLLLDAERQAAIEIQRTLRRQRREAEARLGELAALAPEWQRLEQALARADAVILGAARLDGRELVASDATGAAPLVLSIARAPVTIDRSHARRRQIAIGSGLVALLAALLAGIIFARTRKTFATPDSVARTLGVPVIAAVPQYRT